MECILGLARFGGSALVLLGLGAAGMGLGRGLRWLSRKSRHEYLGHTLLMSLPVCLAAIGVLGDARGSLTAAVAGFLVACAVWFAGGGFYYYYMRTPRGIIVLDSGRLKSDAELLLPDAGKLAGYTVIMGLVGTVLGVSVVGGMVLHRAFGLWSTVPLACAAVVFFVAVGELLSPYHRRSDVRP